ncbi:DUF4240 domain-containing protein [Microbispora sp. CA-102843]|uniref:DUF4240 domain-containing protein n=1 Tax=Microbispora sp. CA-102843 TaxID=3239952 RepID=UPI003D9254D3
MDEAGFWDVIEEAYAALECGYYKDEFPRDAVAQAWRDDLDRLPSGEIVDFAVHFERTLERAWRPEVWAAACLLAGGTADASARPVPAPRRTLSRRRGLTCELTLVTHQDYGSRMRHHAQHCYNGAFSGFPFA